MTVAGRLKHGLPVVDRWFSTLEVTETLTVISEPYVHPFLRANIWHLRGRDGDLIVDSGLGIASLSDELPRLFQRDPVVVITHAHLDHLGGAHEFIECHAHPTEPIMDPWPASLNGPELTGQLDLDPEELPERLPDFLLSAVPRNCLLTETYELLPARRALPLRDGDEIDLGDRKITVLHLPGHSPGSIGLYDAENHALFSGDVVYGLSDGDQLLDGIRGANIDSYVSSLRTLEKMRIDVTYPGHGDPLDADELAAVIDQYLIRRHGKLSGLDTIRGRDDH
jgi:glyoxylase-like metal-dependent hydrolase (beta-lactamase superfamily II)